MLTTILCWPIHTDCLSSPEGSQNIYFIHLKIETQRI